MASVRAAVALNDQHKSLTEFVGEWHVVERMFPAPGIDPIVREGKASCKALLEGRAVFMHSHLTNPDGSPYEAFVVATLNVHKSTLEGIFMDIHSFDGFDPMDGTHVKKLNYGVEGHAAAAITSDATVKRVWNGSVTVPRKAAMFAGGPEQLLGVDRVHMKLVENKINDGKWVLLGIMSDAHGNDYVGIEATYTQ
ncbi:MAG: hypothetical protein QOJ84_3495 [Bradyrhizobium sp.]|nr:hypothetical protein [Bradyrhizobium sp.]